ncbi:MAG: ATP-dependent DNA helicase, partial [Blautia sp.]|nr:ATP-dependent DNA helicase [Blautia sp.]
FMDEDNRNCNPVACPYAKGHFDRINEAVYSLLTEETLVDREKIWQWARRFQVCPFELSLDLSTWLDAVVCDYNYCFDPDVALKRFFADSISGDYIFLIDEAHNLVSRAREMYSASLGEEDLSAGVKAVLSFPKVGRVLRRVRREFSALSGEAWQRELFCPIEVPPALAINMLGLQVEMEAVMADPPREGVPDEFMDFYFLVRSFNQVMDHLGADYLTYLTREGGNRLYLSCMDPSTNLAARLGKGRSAIFFSATLLPLPFYRRLLSKRDDDFGLVLSSPFPRENRLLLLGGDVSTRYRERGYEQYQKIARYLAMTTWQRPGNYIAFFPSYRMLQDVYEVYEQEFSQPWVEVLLQTPSMGEEEREEFLKAFESEEEEKKADREDKNGIDDGEKGNEEGKEIEEIEEKAREGEGRKKRKTLLAFAIMGGIFSEGIDFLGERLIGVFVVGLGLPQVGSQTEALRYFFDQRREDGYAYAYRYPAMNKVLQAAGRVIRTKEDKGVILLLDERFLQSDNKALLPREWDNYEVVTIDSVSDKIRKFYS